MVLLIIAQNEFRDEEYFKPKAVLENAGYKVATASKEAGIAKGKLGGGHTGRDWVVRCKC